MHTCLALMIVGATLNDGDFGVITFDPWYDSEGPLLQQSQMAWLMSVPSVDHNGVQFILNSHYVFTIFFLNEVKKSKVSKTLFHVMSVRKKIIEISKLQYGQF